MLPPRLPIADSGIGCAPYRCAQLVTALSKAEKDAAYLEAQVARGDFRRSTTKVLHLAANPARQAATDKAAEVNGGL